jgi:phytoene desaturase
MVPPKSNVLIIGAGLGGLSCGIHLARAGFGVKILEKNDRPGGRANVVEEKGYRIDMGPTLVLMPEVLEELFRSAGRKLSDYLRLRQLEPAYRIFFADGRAFDMTHDLSKIILQVDKFAPDCEKAFFRYLKDVEAKFAASRSTFIQRNFESLRDVVNFDVLAGFFRIRPFGNAYGHAWSYFRNPYLATAFSCQTLYLGESPFRVPALYNLLAYVEMQHGVWFPEGGMSAIPAALARLFRELGGVLQLGSEVRSVVVENGRAKGVRLADGSVELADAVVSNRDLPASYYHFLEAAERRSLPDRKIRGWHYGSSCVLYYLGIRRKVPRLFHHNIFISGDFRRSCEEIFEKGKAPRQPLLYVCVPTKTDPSLAPEGREAVYILALVPNLKLARLGEEDLELLRGRVFDRLRLAGVDIAEEDIELERRFTPEDFQGVYGSFYGNAFGLAPDLFQSAFFRPATRSRDVRGLYHAGASTHPGSGVPMVLTSGRLVAEQLGRDLAPEAGAARR